MFILYIALILILFNSPIKKLFKKKPIEFDDLYLFDDFVTTDFFAEDKYQLTPNCIATDGVGYELPSEYSFTEIVTGFDFLVKTKYMAKFNELDFEWCDKKRFENYKKIEDITVFVMIGIGEPANFPDELFLIPLKCISSNKLTRNALNDYKVTYNQLINISVY